VTWLVKLGRTSITMSVRLEAEVVYVSVDLG
jgi:hypothetical protein